MTLETTAVVRPNAATDEEGAAGKLPASLPPLPEPLAEAPDAPFDTESSRRTWLQATLHLAGRYTPLLVFFLLWEVIGQALPDLQYMLPPPSVVIDGGWQLIQQGTLQRDVLASLKRVFIALAFASLVGFPLGAALGASKTFAWLFEPIVNFFRPIPPLAWIPLSIVWFGINDAQNEFIIFLGAVFPIILNTMEGVRDVDPQLVRAARTLGASRTSIALTVVLPGALPAMFIGFRIGTGIAWMALVAGELVAATSGLGFLISQGRLLYRSDFIIVGMVMIGLIGLALDGLIRGLQQLVMPWRAEQ